MIVHGDSRRLSGDGGTALVEAAFLSPLIMFLFLGILEGGNAMLNHLSVSNAASGGVRMGSIAGKDGKADFAIINAVQKEGSAIDPNIVTRVVVYKGTAASQSTVPAGCKAGTPANGSCNVYVAADLDDPINSSTFSCASGGIGAKDRFWCPDTRKTALEGTNGPPDWIGVYVEVRHPLITGLFGSSVTMEADMVSRMEPGSLR